MLHWEHSAILLTFIKLAFVIKNFVLSMFEWPFKTGFTVALNVQKFKHFLFLFFNIMLAIGVGIPKRLVGTGNREDHDQTASYSIFW